MESATLLSCLGLFHREPDLAPTPTAAALASASPPGPSGCLANNVSNSQQCKRRAVALYVLYAQHQAIAKRPPEEQEVDEGEGRGEENREVLYITTGEEETGGVVPRRR